MESEQASNTSYNIVMYISGVARVWQSVAECGSRHTNLHKIIR
jgi:hypothetical protein